MMDTPIDKIYRVVTQMNIIKFLARTSETQMDSPKKEFQGRIFDLVFRYFLLPLFSLIVDGRYFCADL